MSIVMVGSTSGSITLQEPAIAGSNTINLPAATGTAVLTGVNGNVDINAAGSNNVILSTNTTERMRIDSSGNVGIGTSSPASGYRLDVTAGTAYMQIQSNTTSAGAIPKLRFNHAGNDGYSIVGGNYMAFLSSDTTERMRINSAGQLLVGATSWAGGATIGFQINATNNVSGAYAQLIRNSSGTEIFQMRCDGGLGNFSANNANLSDERVKTDIKLAGSYLDKICAIPVKTFKYKNQTDDLLNLGVIAQDVEAVAPELVDVAGFGETPDDGIPLKAIYQTDLQYALMKCIQEQQAMIEELKAKVIALENNNG